MSVWLYLFRDNASWQWRPYSVCVSALTFGNKVVNVLQENRKFSPHIISAVVCVTTCEDIQSVENVRLRIKKSSFFFSFNNFHWWGIQKNCWRACVEVKKFLSGGGSLCLHIFISVLVLEFDTTTTASLAVMEMLTSKFNIRPHTAAQCFYKKK